MLLTITSMKPPATDLGFLLHKHPARMHRIDLAAGGAWVFYPEANEERCTAALLLDIDPIHLKRRMRGPSGEHDSLDQYVNDRPYVASSFMSVALMKAFGSAVKGQSKERPELAAQSMPLSATVSVVRCQPGEAFLRQLFEPLGYAVELRGMPLDPRFPEWGASPYYTLTLSATTRLSQLLNHLYVLLPVLDDDKHYWVADDEVEKLLRTGEGWLGGHPAREVITRRYLRHQRRLVHATLARLSDEGGGDAEDQDEARAAEEALLERTLSLNEQRIQRVVEILESTGAQHIIDLGCGEGTLLAALMKNKALAAITGMDVSVNQLERAQRKLQLDRLSDHDRSRLKLFHGSLMYRDDRMAGHEAATVIEVIEHLDKPRLAAFERVVFQYARPRILVVTTPNREYNPFFPGLAADNLRHLDHRFEWTRQEFQQWANRIAGEFGYGVRFENVGPCDPDSGGPTQMAVFERGEGSQS